MPSASEFASATSPQNAEPPRPTTGRTPEGKARSSLNALRHGLTARVVVLPSEDMDAYQAFSKEIVDSLDAQTPVERQFAQTVADNQMAHQPHPIDRRRHARHGAFRSRR